MTRKKRLAELNRASQLMGLRTRVEAGVQGSARRVNKIQAVTRDMSPRDGINGRLCTGKQTRRA